LAEGYEQCIIIVMPQGHDGIFHGAWHHVVWAAFTALIAAGTGRTLDDVIRDFFINNIGVQHIWPPGWSADLVWLAIGLSIFGGMLLLKKRREEPAPVQIHQYFGSLPGQAVAPPAAAEEKPKSISRDVKDIEVRERAICERVEAEVRTAIRDARTTSRTREHQNAINNNVGRENFQRGAVFNKSIDIEIDYYILPLLKKIIQFEANLRSGYKLPFTEKRIKKLNDILRELVMDDWPTIVTNGYRDAFNHVFEKQGRVARYIEEEL